jgi:hypothetical protein
MVVVRDVHGREREVEVEVPIASITAVLKEKTVIDGNPSEIDKDKVDVRLSGGAHFRLDVSDGFNPWGGAF